MGGNISRVCFKDTVILPEQCITFPCTNKQKLGCFVNLDDNLYNILHSYKKHIRIYKPFLPDIEKKPLESTDIFLKYLKDNNYYFKIYHNLTNFKYELEMESFRMVKYHEIYGFEVLIDNAISVTIGNKKQQQEPQNASIFYIILFKSIPKYSRSISSSIKGDINEYNDIFIDYYNNPDKIKLSKARKIFKITKFNFNLLAKACFNNNFELVTTFINLGADVNFRVKNIYVNKIFYTDISILGIAIYNNYIINKNSAYKNEWDKINIKIIELLIEKGADLRNIDNNENSALMGIIYSEKEELFEPLCKKNADHYKYDTIINKNSENILIYILKHVKSVSKCKEYIDILLKNCITGTIDYIDNEGNTPLMYLFLNNRDLSSFDKLVKKTSILTINYINEYHEDIIFLIITNLVLSFENKKIYISKCINYAGARINRETFKKLIANKNIDQEIIDYLLNIMNNSDDKMYYNTYYRNDIISTLIKYGRLIEEKLEEKSVSIDDLTDEIINDKCRIIHINKNYTDDKWLHNFNTIMTRLCNKHLFNKVTDDELQNIIENIKNKSITIDYNYDGRILIYNIDGLELLSLLYHYSKIPNIFNMELSYFNFNIISEKNLDPGIGIIRTFFQEVANQLFEYDIFITTEIINSNTNFIINYKFNLHEIISKINKISKINAYEKIKNEIDNIESSINNLNLKLKLKLKELGLELELRLKDSASNSSKIENLRKEISILKQELETHIKSQSFLNELNTFISSNTQSVNIFTFVGQLFGYLIVNEIKIPQHLSYLLRLQLLYSDTELLKYNKCMYLLGFILDDLSDENKLQNQLLKYLEYDKDQLSNIIEYVESDIPDWNEPITIDNYLKYMIEYAKSRYYMFNYNESEKSANKNNITQYYKCIANLREGFYKQIKIKSISGLRSRININTLDILLTGTKITKKIFKLIWEKFMSNLSKYAKEKYKTKLQWLYEILITTVPPFDFLHEEQVTRDRERSRSSKSLSSENTNNIYTQLSKNLPKNYPRISIYEFRRKFLLFMTGTESYNKTFDYRLNLISKKSSISAFIAHTCFSSLDIYFDDFEDKQSFFENFYITIVNQKQELDLSI